MLLGEKIRLSLFFSVFPFSFVLMAAKPPRYAMITDSIPDHSIILQLGCFAIFCIPAVMNWRLLGLSGQGAQGVAAMFLVGAGSITLGSVDLYNSLYQERLFAKSLPYERIVKIDDTSIENRRSGTNYFANVNPNNIKNIHPKIPIDSDLFDKAHSFIINDKTRAPADRSGCTVYVTVDKSGSAERIRWNRSLNPSDVVSCGG